MAGQAMRRSLQRQWRLHAETFIRSAYLLLTQHCHTHARRLAGQLFFLAKECRGCPGMFDSVKLGWCPARSIHHLPHNVPAYLVALLHRACASRGSSALPHAIECCLPALSHSAHPFCPLPPACPQIVSRPGNASTGNDQMQYTEQLERDLRPATGLHSLSYQVPAMSFTRLRAEAVVAQREWQGLTAEQKVSSWSCPCKRYCGVFPEVKRARHSDSPSHAQTTVAPQLQRNSPALSPLCPSGPDP